MVQESNKMLSILGGVPLTKLAIQRLGMRLLRVWE